MGKEFELTPHNNQKSYYGKAKVIEENGISRLKSYATIVAEYNHHTNKIKVFGYYSPTTARYINSFLDYYGFDTCNKKELENYGNK